jgi:hypothetical protein
MVDAFRICGNALENRKKQNKKYLLSIHLVGLEFMTIFGQNLHIGL